jgi:hypothetical protein
MTFVSCGSDDDDDNSNPVPTPSEENKNAGGDNANTNDLVGSWEAKYESGRTVYTFTDKEVTIENYWTEEGRELKDDDV